MRILFASFLLALLVAFGAQAAPRDPPLAIHSIVADASLTRITLRGASFPTPSATAATVFLRGVRVALPIVSGDDRTLVAQLPAGTGAGTYFVVLGNSVGDPLATFPVALGSVGGQGPQGPAGPAGIAGSAGPQGDPGVAGVAGSSGAQGSTGATGPVGFDGPSGLQGPEGTPGREVQFGRTTFGDWGPHNICGITTASFFGLAATSVTVAAPATIHLWANTALSVTDVDPGASLVFSPWIQLNSAQTEFPEAALTLGSREIGSAQATWSFHTGGGVLRFTLGGITRNPPCTSVWFAGVELQWMVVYD